MTEKQRRFVEEYLIDLNITRAAIRAGYSKKSAPRIGVKLVNKSEVKQAIEAAKQERSKRTHLTQDYVVKNLLEVVERCMQRAPVCNMKGEQIQDEEERNVWQFNARDANKALDLLGKHLGMFQGNGTGRPPTHKEIFERYLNEELSLKEAAIEFEMNSLPIPETIRILLAKEQPEPEDPSKGQYMVISDEEMEKRVAERKAAIEQQLLQLPERQQEMRELHEQVANKFGPNAGKSGNEDK